MYRHSMLLCALAACGGSSAVAWPTLTGHETLSQLKDAREQRLVYQGNRLLSSATACSLDRNAIACQWLSAYWKADYADATTRCEAGDFERCQDAASYALGCEVRGIGAGSPESFDIEDDNTGPDCTHIGGIPLDLVTYPRIDVEKALRLYVSPCKSGRGKAAWSCKETATILASGLMGGIEVPQDLELAHTLFVRGLSLEREEGEDPPGADFVNEEWQRAAGKYIDESAEDRGERIRRVQNAYAKAWQTSTELAATAVELQNHSSWPAVITGLKLGLETNAAVTANLTHAQTEINASVEASMADRRRAQQSRHQQAQQQQAQHQQAQQQQQQQNKAERRAHLEACLAEDSNCEYGTSNRCAPSVAYGDRFGARHVATKVKQIAELCEAKSSMSWAADCYTPKLQRVLEASGFLTLAGNVADVATRVGKLPGKYAEGMPACWGQLLPIPQVVSDLPRYCQSGKKVCTDACTNAEQQLECARQVDEFLYNAESQQHRDELKASHDAECHRTWD